MRIYGQLSTEGIHSSSAPRSLRIVGYCNDLGLDWSGEPCVSFELIESALSLRENGGGSGSQGGESLQSVKTAAHSH